MMPRQHMTIKNKLKTDGLKFEHLIGIGVDDASLMVDVHNSLSVLLKHDIPDVTVVKCLSFLPSLCWKVFQSSTTTTEVPYKRDA